MIHYTKTLKGAGRIQGGAGQTQGGANAPPAPPERNPVYGSVMAQRGREVAAMAWKGQSRDTLLKVGS